jgi:uncharacterized membrane protein YedE/YeeE
MHPRRAARWWRPRLTIDRLAFAVGVAFGADLVAARLNEYDVIHNALLLRDPYLFLMMASAVGVALPVLWLLERRRWRTPLGGPLTLEQAPIERRHVLGAAVFGTGWALGGSCPGPAVAMAAGGGVLGLFVVVGMMAGVSLRERVATRPWARSEASPWQLTQAPVVE